MNDAPWLLPMGYAYIGEVDVGTRRREDMGNLDALAKSIQENGLLHPIVVDAGHRLVSGHRRLEACRMLGWEKIPIRSVGNVTPEQMRELELRENLDRKDFTELELSKNMLHLVEAVKERQREEADFSVVPAKKSSMGRPHKPDSQEAVAKEIGVPQRTISDAYAHVSAVEQYPALQTLPKTTAINIARKAKQIAPKKREEYVNAMATSEKQYAQECKQIDQDAVASGAIHKALISAGGIPFSDEMLDAWLRFDEPDAEDIDNLLFLAEQAIPNLNAIAARLKGHNPLRVIRGGKS